MSWEKFKQHYYRADDLGFALDISRMDFGADFLSGMQPKMDAAFKAMQALEGGAIANPDEDRMVGHYWLRNASLAPTPEIAEVIDATVKDIHAFANAVHAEGLFKNVLIVGIGGSALGPQFVAQALGQGKADKLTPYFFDNTDPDGFEVVLGNLEGQLAETLTVVISKSGGTPEARNGMLEAQAAYKAAGVEFAPRAVAITGEGSKLDGVASAQGWLKKFPMWDWVGGRTSELATVGLVPAALQGIDIAGMLAGARAMDEKTRVWEMENNPAALLAAMWHYITDGKGEKDMVILPYKDRLVLLSKYLQQLIMESLGKEKDLDGNTVHQGIAVYGNKGSTDQHAYVQQLREGVPNFFATFIEVLKDKQGSEPSIEVEPGNTSGEFLNGFYLGTREALHSNGRQSITVTVDALTPQAVGMLIALYERAVGFYASLVNVNAYHQPGVEAGKKAAADTLEAAAKLTEHLKANAGTGFTADELAAAVGVDAELVFKLLEHRAANTDKAITKQPGEGPFSAKYAWAA